MKYGLNYQGSKNPIVKELCEVFPTKTNFYDLFAGGCAVTHRMLEMGRFQRFFISDINPMPLQLFWDCVHGNAPQPAWISREEFFKSKDTDPYVACCFSFGGDWATYAYAKEIESIKEALHYAIVDLDFSRSDALGMNLHDLTTWATWQERRLNIKKVIQKNRIEELQHLERLTNLEYLHNLGHIGSSCSERVTDKLTIVGGGGTPYYGVSILPDSVIYCDIPYRNTHSYKDAFNHDAFYEWCLAQRELVFISEYEMPSDFICVREFYRNDKKSAIKANKVVERLFIPARQEGLFRDNLTSLF